MALTDGEILALVTYLKQDLNLPDILVAVVAKLEGSLASPNPPPVVSPLSPVSFWAFIVVSCYSLPFKISLIALWTYVYIANRWRLFQHVAEG